ncbi:hypothetical protein AMR72_08595 [Flavobacterium psychrophilum]|nr:hypothetical protein AMR72_08595 [Flavobacterium psychrophilum]AOE52557.1 hypothetical protein ALW18_08585 [Flavobacterium psychrophilum]
MVDNIKFFIKDFKNFEENLCKNAIIDLNTLYSPITSEVADYPKTGKFYNMNVRITEQQAFFQGSLHKLINMFLDDEEHNYNDFDIRDIRFATDEITNTFGISPEMTSITNLEFGLNIPLDEDPQIIIDHRLLMSNFKNHSKDLKFRGEGDYKEFIKTDYSIKIYNKSKQYGQDKHILRVEVKFTMKRKLESLGVQTLEDLKSTSVLQNLFEFLMKQFDKLVIVDSFYNRQNILKRDVARLTQFTNPNYWIDAAETKHPLTRDKLIRKFASLIRKYRLDSTKKMLIGKLEAKYYTLQGLTDAIPV